MPRILRFGFTIAWNGRNFIKGLINIPSEDVAPQKLLITLRNFKCIVNTPCAPFLPAAQRLGLKYVRTRSYILLVFWMAVNKMQVHF